MTYTCVNYLLSFTACINSAVLSSTASDQVELGLREPRHWLMVWGWTRAWKHWSNY